MWLLFAFASAVLLGFYDTSKKAALRDNAVLPVLLLNTLFCSLIFSPVTVSSAIAGTLSGQQHLILVAKAAIVLTSWILGYVGLKHLPITIVGPINATRPVLVLLGAMLIFGERLNLYQWIGVILAFLSIFLLSNSSKKKEQIDFAHNRWIWCIAGAAITGAASGLYDKFVARQIEPELVQGWYNLYQFILMLIICLVMRWIPSMKARRNDPGAGMVGGEFKWLWAIPLISVFISAADFAYFSSLQQPESMISVVSLIRRSSVIVSFICGVVIFKERSNMKAKILDLSLILIGMFFIWLGSH
ncbi:MAG: DMT family transporter [Bacteroidales bacterium]|nr:DMT family transporter [Bacteroidales bacterium]